MVIGRWIDVNSSKYCTCVEADNLSGFVRRSPRFCGWILAPWSAAILIVHNTWVTGRDRGVTLADSEVPSSVRFGGTPRVEREFLSKDSLSSPVFDITVVWGSWRGWAS